MLKLYATEAVRNRITLTYRGYDVELTLRTLWVESWGLSAERRPSHSFAK